VAAGFAAALWPAYALDWPRVRIEESSGERLLALAEGSYGIVAVVEDAGSRRLKLNNHYVLGGTLAAGDERMSAHVPLLLHPSPRTVAVLGLGTGITASGALFHPVERLTAVELVPEVVAAARAHFGEANAAVLDDPRTRVVVEDARSYLRGVNERFDVIIGDLVVPWRPGEGELLTLEHFAAARSRLAPGGLFCQWLPLFQLSEPELWILLRTFLSVFPRAQLWRGDFSIDVPALALVGGVEARDPDPAQVRRRLGEMRPDPLNLHLVEPAAFWMHFVGILGLEDAVADRINSEDRPWLELIGPRQHAGASRGPIVAGQRLQDWLGEVRRLSAGRLSGLGASEAAGIEAGILLHDYSLALSLGDEEAARSAQVRLGGLLPSRAFEAIFPEAAGTTRR
jgi:spermidine synthase